MPHKQETVPSFDSVDELIVGLQAKARYDQTNLYPRDGQESLGLAEEIVADLVGVKAEQAVIFSNGMAAIDTVVEAGLDQAGVTEPVIAYSQVLYSQSSCRLRSIAQRGVRGVQFDSADPSAVERVLEKHQPTVVFSETVGNGAGTPVLDWQHLLEVAANIDSDPTVVLDNTNPLNTGLPIVEKLQEDQKIVVVESGTKSYTKNAEISGIAYAKNPQLLLAIKALRRQKGTIPGVGSSERIKLLLPESRREFDERNLRLFANTAFLAAALEQVDGKDFVVSHPHLKSHDNYQLAKDLHLPQGASQVLFLQPTSLAHDAHIELLKKLYNHPGVRQHADLGQSFGFDRTRLLYDENACVVRVAGGADTDVEELARYFGESLT